MIEKFVLKIRKKSTVVDFDSHMQFHWSPIHHVVIYDMQGFLEDSLKRPALQKSRKRIAHSTEQYMKLLEALDGLNLDPSNSGGRAKRKSLVDRIHVGDL